MMRKMLLISLVVVLMLSLSGCFSFLSREYDISGVVTDFEGNPIEGVEVVAETDEAVLATTDAEGKFALSGLKGSVQISASKDGYLFTGPITVTEKAEVEFKGVEGTVTQTGEGTVKVTFSEEGTATLRATPAAGWLFARWTGDVESTEDTVEVEVDGPLAVTAVFISPVTEEGYIKWTEDLFLFPEFWEQLYGRSGFEYKVEDGLLWVKMASAYCYAGIQDVLIPANAVKARVSILACDSDITKTPWRLRIVDKSQGDQGIKNVAGGVKPAVGTYEAEFPSDVLEWVQQGLPLQVELGGAWDEGKWVAFYLEFLDAEGNPVRY